MTRPARTGGCSPIFVQGPHSDPALRVSPLSMRWLWPAHQSRAIGAGSYLGRPALGVAPGDAGVSSAARPMPAVWDSDRAPRVRGPEGAGDASLPPADRRGLSIDVFCEAYGIAPVEPAERSDWSRIQLQPENATNTLSIRTPTRVIPVMLGLPSRSRASAEETPNASHD